MKILPSAIYWGGITRYGILTTPLAPDELGARSDASLLDPEAADERAERAPTNWQRTIERPPEGFPSALPGGLTLRPAEARWLQEVILHATPDTLLAHCMASADRPDLASTGPWDDPVARRVGGETAATLEAARLFSLVHHGAALLYNLLLAEAYEEAGLTRLTGAVDRYQERLGDWAMRIEADRPALASWDLATWWSDALVANPRIGPATQHFVTTWIELVRSNPAADIPTKSEARSIIAKRERSQKKAQARLLNERMLRNWNGASGADPLDYRWATVRRLIDDVVSALEPTDARA